MRPATAPCWSPVKTRPGASRPTDLTQRVASKRRLEILFAWGTPYQKIEATIHRRSAKPSVPVSSKSVDVAVGSLMFPFIFDDDGGGGGGGVTKPGV